MKADTIKRLRDLSAQAQKETDPDKLMSIIQQIEQLFGSAESVPPLFLGKRTASDEAPGGPSSEP